MSCDEQKLLPAGPVKSDLLMWGRSYYLQTEAYDHSKVYWKPLKNVPPYTWYRPRLEGHRMGKYKKMQDWVGFILNSHNLMCNFV